MIRYNMSKQYKDDGLEAARKRSGLGIEQCTKSVWSSSNSIKVRSKERETGDLDFIRTYRESLDPSQLSA